MSYCLETFPGDNSSAAEFVQTDADENSLNLFAVKVHAFLFISIQISIQINRFDFFAFSRSSMKKNADSSLQSRYFPESSSGNLLYQPHVAGVPFASQH